MKTEKHIYLLEHDKVAEFDNRVNRSRKELFGEAGQWLDDLIFRYLL
jgi:hypothetical protein